MAKKPEPDLSDMNVAADALGERSMKLIGMILQRHHKGVLEGVMEKVDQFSSRIRELEAALREIVEIVDGVDSSHVNCPFCHDDHHAGCIVSRISALLQKDER